MKPHVDFFIPSYENKEEGMVMHFTSVSQIDDVIESLNEARIELARQIEAKRINNRERRRPKKERLALDKFNVRQVFDGTIEKDEQMLQHLSSKYDKILKLYENMPECKFKNDLKPYIEIAKALLDCVKND